MAMTKLSESVQKMKDVSEMKRPMTKHRYGIDLGDGWIRTDFWGILQEESCKAMEDAGVIVVLPTHITLTCKDVIREVEMKGMVKYMVASDALMECYSRYNQREYLVEEEESLKSMVQEERGMPTERYKW